MNSEVGKKNGGFTLLEVLVALTIIAIGFFGIYNLHIQTISAAESVRFYMKAPMLARMKIAEIDSSGGAELSEESGIFEDDFSEFSWKIVPREIESETLGEATTEKLVCYDLEIFNSSGSYTVGIYRFRVNEE